MLWSRSIIVHGYFLVITMMRLVIQLETYGLVSFVH
jgi:hypothetical protein